jgi:methyl-accepting chemotaxis protein
MGNFNLSTKLTLSYLGVALFPLLVSGLITIYEFNKLVNLEKSGTSVSLNETFITLITTFTISALISILFTSVLSYIFSKKLNNKLEEISETLKLETSKTIEDSKKVKDASQSVSSGTNQQASAIQQTVATLSEITAMVDKTLDGVNVTMRNSKANEEVSNEGQEAVREMIRAMDEITLSNGNISKTVSNSNIEIEKIVGLINDISDKTQVINDIVFQTKLLSFNASVEAARAGEHGKGFSVVAEEVGNLAHMSGKAAKEITEMLTGSIKQVEGVVNQSSTNISKLMKSSDAKIEVGAQVAKRCGEVFDEIRKNAGNVSKSMEDLSYASKEQADGVSNISIAMNELDDATQKNANMAHATSSYSDSLFEMGQKLNQTIGGLEHVVYGSKSTNAGNDNHDEKGTPGHNVLPFKIFEETRSTYSTSEKVAVNQDFNEEQPVESDENQSSVSSADSLPNFDDPRFEDI